MLEGSSTRDTGQPIIAAQLIADWNDELPECSEQDWEAVSRKRSCTSPSKHSPSLRHSDPAPKRYKIQQVTQLSTNNRFAPLANQLPADTPVVNVNVNNRVDNVDNVKIPPIFITNVDNVQEITADLKTMVTGKFYLKQCFQKIKLQLTTSDDYRRVTKYYDDEKVEFYTYSNPDDRRLSVVIRGLSLSYSEEEIKSELINLSYDVISVTKLKGRGKVPLPLCAVELRKGHNKDDSILKLTDLFNMVVSVEPRRKPTGLPQCINCQRYGHTKNFCRLSPRCVKCTGTHHFTACPIKKTDKPVCVNCNKEHTANYRGCEYYRKLKNRINRPSHTSVPLEPSPAHTATQHTHTRTAHNMHTSTTQQPRINSSKNTNSYPTWSSLFHSHDNTSHVQNDLTKLLQDALTSLIQAALPQIKHFLTSLLTGVFSGNHGQP